MQLREMIEIGAKKAGNQELLAKVIGVSGKFLTEAKSGRRGLPAESCGKLADLIGIDRWKVLAASNLVTEKNEEKRAYWIPFVLNGVTAVASVTIALVGTVAPNDAKASDTFNVSSTSSQPAPLTDSMWVSIRIM